MTKFYALVAVIVVTAGLIGAHAMDAQVHDDRAVISYLQPDGSGARESIRLWSVVAGATRYYAFFIDGTRWMLTDAGAVSCDAPEASPAWLALVEEHRADIKEACSWRWVRWAFAHALPDPEAPGPRQWGDYDHYRSFLRVTCGELFGPVWDGMTAERQQKVEDYCNEPERKWQP